MRVADEWKAFRHGPLDWRVFDALLGVVRQAHDDTSRRRAPQDDIVLFTTTHVHKSLRLLVRQRVQQPPNKAGARRQAVCRQRLKLDFERELARLRASRYQDVVMFAIVSARCNSGDAQQRARSRAVRNQHGPRGCRKHGVQQRNLLRARFFGQRQFHSALFRGQKKTPACAGVQEITGLPHALRLELGSLGRRQFHAGFHQRFAPRRQRGHRRRAHVRIGRCRAVEFL